MDGGYGRGQSEQSTGIPRIPIQERIRWTSTRTSSRFLLFCPYSTNWGVLSMQPRATICFPSWKRGYCPDPRWMMFPEDENLEGCTCVTGHLGVGIVLPPKGGEWGGDRGRMGCAGRKKERQTFGKRPNPACWCFVRGDCSESEAGEGKRLRLLWPLNAYRPGCGGMLKPYLWVRRARDARRAGCPCARLGFRAAHRRVSRL